MLLKYSCTLERTANGIVPINSYSYSNAKIELEMLDNEKSANCMMLFPCELFILCLSFTGLTHGTSITVEWARQVVFAKNTVSGTR